MFNIFRRKETKVYEIETNEKYGYIVFDVLNRRFSTYSCRYVNGSDENYIVFTSTRTRNEIYSELKNVFGNVCNVTKENGKFIVK